MQGGQFQFRAGDEQEHQHAQLADQPKRAERAGREQPGLGVRHHRAEQQRPQQQAGGHFADDGRLAEAAQQPARALGHGQHHQQLQQEQRQRRTGARMRGVGDGCRGGRGHRHRPAREQQRRQQRHGDQQQIAPRGGGAGPGLRIFHVPPDSAPEGCAAF